MALYDSTPDTMAHIDRVRQLLTLASAELIRRGEVHDSSALVDPEKSWHDEIVSKIALVQHGSPDYSRVMADLRYVQAVHAQNNQHHPEYYPGGVNDFDLFDLIEMFFDWVAENPDGGIIGKIEAEDKIGTISPQVARIFYNTSQRYVELIRKVENGTTK